MREVLFDWELLKRMAARFHSFLVPSTRTWGVKYFYDLPKGERYELADHMKNAVKKDLGDYRRKRNQGLSKMPEGACLEYILQSREEYQIGDQLTVNGLQLFVWKMDSVYERGEMLHTCHLKSRSGMDFPETFQEDRTGCSFQAEVLQVKEDEVMVKVLKDENQEQNINLWYPYSAAVRQLCFDLVGEIMETEAFQKAVKAENFTAFFGRYQGEGEIIWRMKER